jgi:hypothetical protein
MSTGRRQRQSATIKCLSLSAFLPLCGSVADADGAKVKSWVALPIMRPGSQALECQGGRGEAPKDECHVDRNLDSGSPNPRLAAGQPQALRLCALSTNLVAISWWLCALATHLAQLISA